MRSRATKAYPTGPEWFYAAGRPSFVAIVAGWRVLLEQQASNSIEAGGDEGWVEANGSGAESAIGAVRGARLPHRHGAGLDQQCG